MQIQIEPFTVHKRVPLTISRGTNTGSTNLWVRVKADGIEGWGEASPFSTDSGRQTTEEIKRDLAALVPIMASLHPIQRQMVESRLAGLSICSAARAAIDVALHDWMGKCFGLPLWQLWGLELQRIGPTAVTVGLSTPEGAVDRLSKWCDQQQVNSVKIKLGSPEGILIDKKMFAALLPEIPAGAKVSVDANGGWGLEDAIAMSYWLSERGVIYIEQPMSIANNKLLPNLYAQSPLPIYVDESCFTSADIPSLAHCIHGINIKLMKSGGLSEAQRMIHTARACDLKVMFGCYSDSIISNTALSHLSPLADHLDLDSHFNMKDDPFSGAQLKNGCLVPNAQPGLGLTHAQP